MVLNPSLQLELKRKIAKNLHDLAKLMAAKPFEECGSGASGRYEYNLQIHNRRMTMPTKVDPMKVYADIAL